MAEGSGDRDAGRAHRDYRARVPGIDYGILDGLVGYRLRRAQLRLYEDFDRLLGADGITPQRFAALVLIARNPGIGQGRLAAVMGIARTGAKALVDGLLARGWVDRTPDAADRRQRGLALTATGRAATDRLSATVADHDARMAAILSAEERATLGVLLDKLADADPAADHSVSGPPKLKP